MSRPWTESELQRIREFYAAAGHEPIDIDSLASELGRSYSSVAIKASRLGLADICRRGVPGGWRPPAPKYKTQAERNAAVGAATKARIEANGHPRGFRGHRHSESAKDAVSQRNVAAWANHESGHRSEVRAQRLSDAMVARTVARIPFRGHVRNGNHAARSDLGTIQFKSSWEANYARYLNALAERGAILTWEFEPKTFVFPDVRRGARTYTPDFKVYYDNGDVEWHEVKGYLCETGALRLARMAESFPHERVVVRDEKWFARARRTGLPWRLPGWELKGGRVV